MGKLVNIIIIEDHALTRIGLKTALETSPNIKVIAEAEYAEDGINLAKELDPDLVVMDLGLPNMNGIDATKIIKEYNSEIKILILTSHNNEKEVIESLGAGADAYCMKDINPQRLISIIEGIVEGGAWLDPSIAKTVLGKVINLNPSDIVELKEISNEPVPLTDREIEILQLIADGLSNPEIAIELSLSPHTVKSHICNILQKLSVDDRTQAIVRAMRNGWVK